MIPRALAELAACPWGELLLVRPGLVYRKDAIDRLHTGEPHQVDLWHLRRGEPPLEEADLMQLIARAVEAALPGARWRTTPAVHPYTLAGRQIDVECGRSWIEIGECGLAHPEVLAILEKGTVVCPPKGLGLAKGTVVCPPRGSGLAMGLGLDRLLMLRKGIDDIRLLRAEDPRIARQLLDLEPYRRVSVMPPIRRDLSIAVAAGTGDEDLGAEVRAALGADAAAVEEIAIVSRTHAAALPPAAIARMGIGRDQENVLLRVVLRHPDRTLTHAEANALRDRIYAAVHRGSRMEWAG
jgi:phenylalanyl-tRNA synthetase alpha chain